MHSYCPSLKAGRAQVLVECGDIKQRLEKRRKGVSHEISGMENITERVKGNPVSNYVKGFTKGDES